MTLPIDLRLAARPPLGRPLLGRAPLTPARLPIRIALWALASLALGCEQPLPGEETYYDREIAPSLVVGCQMTTSGCHLANEHGSAPGNLDLASYDSLRRRYDLLVPYGPYARPMLLLKTGEPEAITVDVHDPPDPSQPDMRTLAIETDIRHAGGLGLPQGSLARASIQRWLAEGFDRHGAIREPPRAENSGECAPGAGHAPGFSVDDVPDATLFEAFTRDVQPILSQRCAGDACHGAVLADFHLACDETEEERRWNFWIATRFLGDPIERSELLAKPLAVADGGAFHGGGDTFVSRDDPEYRAIADFAAEVAERAPALVRDDDVSEGYRYFVNRVQPTLVRKGCMALACHSPLSVAFHLRGGSNGAFSRFSRRLNYETTLSFLALESDDPNQSRLIGKNLHPAHLAPDAHGMLHRGGALLEDFGGTADASDCEGIDAQNDPFDEVPAYCVLRRWHALERAARVDAGELDEDVRAIAFVARPPGIGDPTDFDTYRPGADLRVAPASTGPDGALLVEASRSVLSACGLEASRADVRRPRVRWDGGAIAFAARSSAETPLRLYELDLATDRCVPIDTQRASERDGDVLVHDLDPAYAPDGSIVFASTRGDAQGRATRTPARLQPNADLYVLSPDRTSVRQLTFLLNQELAPGFLANGQVIYTVEKRELDFHVLALRRQNLDGGDYHPLYASRTSLGFDVAHDVSVLPNGNGLFLASTLGAPDGAGSVLSFNRSLGPDQGDRGLAERGYFPSSLRHLASALHGGRGLYRSPSPLPSGRVLVACAPDATADTDAIDFDLCELEPRSGAMRRLLGEVGVAELDAIAVYARPNRGVLASDGGDVERPIVDPDADDAFVQFNDFPMIQSLMFSNTREGRPIDLRIGGFEVWAHRPPPAGLSALEGANVVTDSRGAFYSEPHLLGFVPLYADGSTSVRMPGGLPISFAMTDRDGVPLPMMEGAPFEGMAVQREHEQYYPGERIKRSIPRRFFNTACGGCHGSITGRELDIAIDVDIVTGASLTEARGAEPHDLRP
jgi:hypothetical protein